MKFTFQSEARPLDGYTIKRAIDRGGFGEVYYALSDSGKEVALKLLQHNLDVELRGIQQCLNLKHPNLLAIYDVRKDRDGDHWVVMEYISGKTLDKVLRDHPQGLPIEEVQRWLNGAIEGLAFLHDRGIVHRDVKPGNIFVDQGVVKIGDVGLSKFVSPSRRSAHTESVGTVYYMAPEIAHGRYGCEVDVYSLGIILYEMLAGRVPFDGETTGEILMKQLSQSPDLSVIPPALRPVVARALHKDPRMRTPTVRQLGQEFQAALRMSGTGARDTAATEASIWLNGDGAGTRSAGTRNAAYTEKPVHRYRRAVQAPAPFWRRFEQQPWGILLLAIAFTGLVFGGPRMFVGRGFSLLLLIGGIILVARYFLQNSDETDSTATARNHSPPPTHKVRRARRHVVPPGPTTLRKIGAWQRAAELSTSMSWSALYTLLLAGFISFLAPAFGDPGHLWSDTGRTGLFLLTTLLGTWNLLAVCKWMEGRDLAMSFKRLVLLVAGIGTGAAAFWLDQVLLVDLGYSHLADSSLFRTVGHRPLLTESWQPTLMGYMVTFGSLFALRHWYWHVDSYRVRRFKLSSLLLTSFVALLLPLVFAFPQSWAVSWAAAISVVAQLSAVWIRPEHRFVELEEVSHA